MRDRDRERARSEEYDEGEGEGRGHTRPHPTTSDNIRSHLLDGREYARDGLQHFLRGRASNERRHRPQGSSATTSKRHGKLVVDLDLHLSLTTTVAIASTATAERTLQ